MKPRPTRERGNSRWSVRAVRKRLKQQSNLKALEGMARYGIAVSKAYGVSIPKLRAMAREIGVDHSLARQLWDTGVHEGRILAGMIDDPKQVTERQMERWVRDFNSWDVCDQCCLNLLDRTRLAWRKAVEWSARAEEFQKRAAFALMAVLAAHDKSARDERFLRFLPIIRHEAPDPRNYVKKAVNWALRQIGKRNVALNKAAIRTAKEISRLESIPARWIAADALRELTGEAVQRRLRS